MFPNMSFLSQDMPYKGDSLFKSNRFRQQFDRQWSPWWKLNATLSWVNLDTTSLHVNDTWSQNTQRQGNGGRYQVRRWRKNGQQCANRRKCRNTGTRKQCVSGRERRLILIFHHWSWRLDTRLPKSPAGGQGCKQSLLIHLHRSSYAKTAHERRKRKKKGKLNGRMDGQSCIFICTDDESSNTMSMTKMFRFWKAAEHHREHIDEAGEVCVCV